MKSIYFVLYSIIFLLTLAVANDSLAQVSVYDNAKVLAVIPVGKGRIDRSVYRQFDRIVPELKGISKNRILILEYSYTGHPEREQDVLSAYQAAGRIEKYLRIQHKLELDLWVSIRFASKQSIPASAFTISVFADDINNANSWPAEHYKSGEY